MKTEGLRGLRDEGLRDEGLRKLRGLRGRWDEGTKTGSVVNNSVKLRGKQKADNFLTLKSV